MDKKPPQAETVDKSFLYRFAVICILLFLCGALLTFSILQYSMHRGPAASYAESYRMLAEFRETILQKSFIVYLFTTLLIIIGVAFIGLLYSHRVAGPLFKLGMIARKIAGGDLSGKVKLRETDVVHPISDDLNTFTAAYREVLEQLEPKAQNLKRISARLDASPRGELHLAAAELSKEIDEIKKILSTIKL